LPSAKSARVSERKRQKNAPLRSKAKTFVAKARNLMAANELDEAEVAVKDAVVALDKAAQKGAIHKRNASRRKARLMKRLSVTRQE
jgi:small subunit ribosomal protein S20